jgi:hypothetical protein
METDETFLDPAAAAAQLAALRTDRGRMAERVVPPRWYDAGLGLSVFLALASISLRDAGAWRYAALGAGVVLLWGLVSAYKRITGVWVNGLRPGRTRKTIGVWLAVYVVVLTLAAWAEFGAGLHGAVAVGGAALGVAIALISRWWTRIYVAELRGEL